MLTESRQQGGPGGKDRGLVVRSVEKRFGRHRVLAGVSFSVAPGGILGLIGPNGAGKSTLLECVTGLLPMDRGTVEWQGRAVPPSRRKQVLWYQPDDIHPFAGQPIGTTLSFFRRAHGQEARELTRLVDGLGLSPMLARPLASLSKGFRRRLLLALALLSRQPVLFLDEPFDGFDLRQSLAVMALLRAWCRDRALVLSIHQLSEAERICDDFLLLDQGRVMGSGSLASLRKQTGLGHDAGLEEVYLALA